VQANFSTTESQPRSTPGYRGRIAPSPTGFLHLGHALTFWTAQERAREFSGILVFRNEDLDPARSKPHFTAAMREDLRWFGIQWEEGPDVGGSFGPYEQSGRRAHHLSALMRLAEGGFLFPCFCSRKDIERAAQAPNLGDEEPLYPGTCRNRCVQDARSFLDQLRDRAANPHFKPAHGERPPNWRFRVPDGEAIPFEDVNLGPRRFVAGRDFGDFIVWRHDDVPAYQLAVVADDDAMRITEVVRGADLLVSTARQLLLYRALGWPPPRFFHCPLVTDASGARLAKRHDSLSLRALRERGLTPESIRAQWKGHHVGATVDTMSIAQL
jgi:glutamyl-tRNA synthetase